MLFPRPFILDFQFIQSQNVFTRSPVHLTWHVVGAQDADLVASADLAREHTAESQEAALVGGGNHLGDVHHERAIGVAVSDGSGVLVIQRALVQGVHTVALGLHVRVY